ncbi:MAG: FHA domain-containing protein [Clostridium sp.]|nr:FHA domain-containing protein [Clostridium sp.]
MEKTGLFSIVPVWGWPVLAVLLFLVVFIVHQVRKRGKQRKKMEELAYLKRRDEALSNALRNPVMGTDGYRDMNEKPLEVRWEEKVVYNGRNSGPAWMIELTELTEYARRKYVFRLDQFITLGSAENNTLVLAREGVAPVHCEIFAAGNRVCLRSRSGVNTLLQRKKRQILVGNEGIMLHDGDMMRLGTAALEIRIFRA